MGNLAHRSVCSIPSKRCTGPFAIHMSSSEDWSFCADSQADLSVLCVVLSEGTLFATRYSHYCPIIWKLKSCVYCPFPTNYVHAYNCVSSVFTKRQRSLHTLQLIQRTQRTVWPRVLDVLNGMASCYRILDPLLACVAHTTIDKYPWEQYQSKETDLCSSKI